MLKTFIGYEFPSVILILIPHHTATCRAEESSSTAHNTAPGVYLHNLHTYRGFRLRIVRVFPPTAFSSFSPRAKATAMYLWCINTYNENWLYRCYDDSNYSTLPFNPGAFVALVYSIIALTVFVCNRCSITACLQDGLKINLSYSRAPRPLPRSVSQNSSVYCCNSHFIRWELTTVRVYRLPEHPNVYLNSVPMYK